MTRRCENCRVSMRRKRTDNSSAFKERRFCSVPCRRDYEDRHGRKKK